MVLSGPDWPVAVLTASEPLTPASFTEETLTGLHAVAEAAAIALVNQIREQERDDARDKIMLALAKLAESRDPETGKHLERVQNYCRILAEQLATTDKYAEVITPDFIRTLVRSSPLHDIGKVGIPDEILLKPGRLTTQEFEIMKRHPIIGGDTIRTLVAPNGHHDFLKMAMEIAYHHHEKYDGTGYPAGLAGEAIPLSARIIAVADVYDALTSVRVYKAAMPHERAREIVFEGSGKHFDPTIVQAFLDREPEFAKLARDLADTDKW
jgi:putative two-component system response regulator